MLQYTVHRADSIGIMRGTIVKTADAEDGVDLNIIRREGQDLESVKIEASATPRNEVIARPSFRYSDNRDLRNIAIRLRRAYDNLLHPLGGILLSETAL